MTDIENGQITPGTAVTVSEPQDNKPRTANDIKAQVQLVQEVMQAVMQDGYHYGVIPGTQKPTLLKPGAEKLIVTFRLAPMLTVERIDLTEGHREYQVKCTLVHIPTGRVFGEGIGACSTMETKYRWRQSERLCPHCGKPTIIKGKAEYGGGWLCFAKKGGCGAKFADRDEQITDQPTGRAENPDLADIYNTILKMAKKRALVDATLTATAASDIFTQDLEPEEEPEPVAPAPPAPTGPPPIASGLQGGKLTTRPQQEGMLTLKQWLELKEVAEMCHIDERKFKAYLKKQGWTDRFSIPEDKLLTILDWLRANEDNVP